MKNLMGKVNAKMKDNRRNGRKALKGFTLVEIIVVLVILAILAAAMIPALTGYIDKANEKVSVQEARNVLTAAQTLCSEAYGLGKEMQRTLPEAKTGVAHYQYLDILKLADVRDSSETTIDTTGNNKSNITSLTINDGKKVTALVYVTTKGKTVTYDGTEFSIS